MKTAENQVSVTGEKSQPLWSEIQDAYGDAVILGELIGAIGGALELLGQNYESNRRWSGRAKDMLSKPGTLAEEIHASHCPYGPFWHQNHEDEPPVESLGRVLFEKAQGQIRRLIESLDELGTREQLAERGSAKGGAR